MPNIQLNYLYRDAGNYKNHGSVIFSNKQHHTIEYLSGELIGNLIDSEYFYAEKWQVPDLHSDKWNNQLDHTFHEFKNLEFTEEQPSMLIDIVDWLKLL